MYIFVKYKVFILVKLIIAFEYLKIIILEFIIQKQAKNYHAKKNNTAKKLHSLYTLLNCTMLLVHKANSCKKQKQKLLRHNTCATDTWVGSRCRLIWVAGSWVQLRWVGFLRVYFLESFRPRMSLSASLPTGCRRNGT